MDGWISLHRQFVKWEWYDDNNTKSLFLHLLLRANHKQNKWRGVTIPKGSLVTGRKKLSIETGLSEQQIRTSLNKLKSTNEITIKTTNLNSLISITNWNKYQTNNQPSNQQITNDQPTNNQQITTNNNDNNDNNNLESIGENDFSKFDITRSVVEDHLSDEEKQDRVNNLREELTNSQIWFESVMRSTGLSSTKTEKMINDFLNHIISTGEYCHPLSDIKRHSVNWIKKQKINEQHDRKKRHSSDALKEWSEES